MKKIFTVFILLSANMQLVAQISLGPTVPGTCNDVFSLGKAEWFGEDNILLSNNVHAYSTALLLGDTTQNLITKNFGFSIPATAVITGIKVEVEKSRDGLKDNVRDASVKIIKGGMITGTEHKSALKWPRNDSVVSYGGSLDNWGISWSVADINSSNFGFSISARLNTDLTSLEFLSAPVLPVAKIDQIRMTVFYSNPLPIQLTGFYADCQEEGARLNWSVATQSNNDYFSVERSADGMQFQAIAVVDGSGNVSQSMTYSYTDAEDHHNQTMYYRLGQTDLNGQQKYSDPVAVACKKQDQLEVYPNPVNDLISVSFYQQFDDYTLKLCDAYGNVVHQSDNVSSDKTQIHRGNLPQGLYTVVVESQGNTLTRKVVLM